MAVFEVFEYDESADKLGQYLGRVVATSPKDAVERILKGSDGQKEAPDALLKEVQETFPHLEWVSDDTGISCFAVYSRSGWVAPIGSLSRKIAEAARAAAKGHGDERADLVLVAERLSAAVDLLYESLSDLMRAVGWAHPVELDEWIVDAVERWIRESLPEQDANKALEVWYEVR